MRKQRGITLISLVITIVVLIILAGVAINMTLGENGIFNKAQEAKRMQAIASAKEQIGLEILEAQIEAMENNEELEQSQVEAIVAKYGVLQADGDTIILNDTEYEVSLRDIYNTMAETETDGDTTTELAQLKALLAQTTVTEDKILKDYKAYKDGQLITGTMENYAGQIIETASVTTDNTKTYFKVPQAGYYDTNSKISTTNSNLVNNAVTRVGVYIHNSISDTVIGQGYADLNVSNKTTLVIGTLQNNGSKNFTISEYKVKLYLDGTEINTTQNTTHDISSYSNCRVLLQISGTTSSNGADVSYSIPVNFY